ncbi:MAG: type II secretion system F family protein [Candidatus Aminicenantes bacterium]|uniref:Putative secretion system W protein GspF-like n=1 Tax=Candidatus Saccharicenans subterraneus TaxID=2508984 RepID=A0A3E2BK87_9BACT|nr:type II secretion system F family protein [Candidatus Aminicenantes bacterium]RFT15160.1 MAG: putative secretion system W protein GspF-like [Candidatus Saccharicenans subterraneum]
MPAFICRIVTSDGRILRETLEAASAEDCRRTLEAEGLCVLSIRKELRISQVRLFGKRLKPAEFILFNQELVALLKAGYPVLKSLELVEKRVENPFLLDIIRQVEAEVRGGKTLSEAFSPYENLFSKVYTASLMAGERSGNLPGSLARYIQYAKIIDQTRSRVRSALLYPTLLVIFSAILIGLLVGLVLPRFATFYADFGAQLPGLTRFLLRLAIFIRANLLWFGLLFLALIITYLVIRRRDSFIVFKDRLKLRLPFSRFLVSDSAVALYSRTLGLLLEAGITLLSSVSVAAFSVPNRFISSRLLSVADSLKNGLSLYDSLQKAGVLPQLAMDMIRIGESSANLPGMLAEVADFYDERLRDRIQTLVSLIEPVIIIFIGLVAAGMILSIYLPIFNIIRITR